MIIKYRSFRKGSLQKTADEYLPTSLNVTDYSKIKLSVLDDSLITCKPKLSDNLIRNYSRQVLWIFEMLEELNLKEALLDVDSNRVGIYFGGRGYVTPWEVFVARNKEGLSRYKAVRFNYRPLHSLKYNSGMTPAHISIHYGIRGPTNAFIEMASSSYSAYEKAKMDLNLGIIDLAVVICANIFEEQFHILRGRFTFTNYSKTSPYDIVNVEAVSAQLLTKENQSIETFEEPKSQYFGYLECLRKDNYLGLKFEE